MSDTSDTFDFSKSKLTPGSGTKIPAVDTSGQTDVPGYILPSEMPISTSMQQALNEEIEARENADTSILNDLKYRVLKTDYPFSVDEDGRLNITYTGE